MNYIIFLFLEVSLFFFTSPFNGHMANTINKKQNCDSLEVLIIKVVKLKLAYEKSNYFKDKGQVDLKKKYSNLVREFKQEEKKESYCTCLRQLIINDSLSPNKKIVEFTYQPKYDSKINKCTYVSYSDFLKIMLANLSYSNNNSTLECKL